MKLQQINEARQAGQPRMFYGVATYDEGMFLVVAPFKSEKEAQRYVEWEAEEFGLDEDELAEVIMIEPPQWTA